MPRLQRLILEQIKSSDRDTEYDNMQRKDPRESVEIEFRCINPRSISDDHYVAAQDEKYINGELVATRKVCRQAAGRGWRIV